MAQDPKDGSPTAAIVGTDAFMVPTGWNTDGAIGRTAGRVDGRIVLIVGNDATANASTLDDGTDDARNGTTLWRSTGTKHSNNSLTGPTTTGPTDRNK